MQAWRVLGLAVLIGAAPALSAQPPAKPVDGAGLLSRIQSAAVKLTYAGTFVYQEDSLVQSSRISHLADSGGETEKLEILDGKAQELIRHNDDVRTYNLEAKTVVVETRSKTDNFPALLASSPAEIDGSYDVQLGGLERVAGRNTSVVSLTPRDSLRYGYKLWSDQETGLLLKAQTLNGSGEVLEQAAFTDVSIGSPIDRARLRPPAGADQWAVQKYDSKPVNFATLGWTVAAQLPGFKKVSEVMRSLGGRPEVGQMVFSDGLAAISVFIEPSDGERKREGDANKGPVNVSIKKSGDHWLTVVGEVPAAAIHKVMESVTFHAVKQAPGS